jgi:hypothetical protein
MNRVKIEIKETISSILALSFVFSCQFRVRSRLSEVSPEEIVFLQSGLRALCALWLCSLWFEKYLLHPFVLIAMSEKDSIDLMMMVVLDYFLLRMELLNYLR